jgi:hypothetical protein
MAETKTDNFNKKKPECRIPQFQAFSMRKGSSAADGIFSQHVLFIEHHPEI